MALKSAFGVAKVEYITKDDRIEMPLVITHREKTPTYTNKIKVLHAE